MSINIHIGPDGIFWIILFLWLILGFIMGIKQSEASDNPITGGFILIVLFAPIMLIGAIIRQVFIEKWK